MFKMRAALFAMVALFCQAATAGADEADKITIAVFGDWPYSQVQFDNASLLVNSINADRDVRRVIFVGDIHSGDAPCTGAGLSPVPAAADPGWSRKIYAIFQRFDAPFIYTPGDNEWSDCPEIEESKSGYPPNELADVRSIFFARPGRTLGHEDMPVSTQAKHFDPRHPSDATFVENVMWEDAGVVFVTLNVPGGNDDTHPWKNGFANPQAQAREISDRNGANLRWLEAAFQHAQTGRKKAIVVIFHADMWYEAALGPGQAGLGAYTPFVQRLAALSLSFGRPVLLLNGDSHLYLQDRPLADPNSRTGSIHHAPAVPNLTRIVVQGSTNVPAEWLRLTIDSSTPEVFHFDNVVYCKDAGSFRCQ
jgi:Calcineurin-like phosphoesterase